MKKILCTLLVLIASVVSAYAQDAITANNVTIPQGSVATLEVDMINSIQYGGFQFDLQLPAGISATGVQKAPRLAQMTSFSLQMNLVDETKNIYRVLGKNDDRLNIEGNSGDVLLYITLTPEASIQAGADLEAGQITGIVLSTINATDTKPANTSFTITISEPLATVTLNETSTTVPASSNGAFVDVLVNRTIKANEWSTIVLPFDMTESQVASAFGDDAQLAEFSKWSYEGDPDEAISSIQISFSKVKSTTKHIPYAIKVSKDISNFKVFNVVVDKKKSGSPKKSQFDTEEDYVGTMTGYYKVATIPENQLFISGNKFWYSVGSTSIKAFRASFDFGDIVLSQDNASRITMSFDDPTGINEVKAVEDGKFYNLSGQQVKPEKKGLYIQNGKKKIIK